MSRVFFPERPLNYDASQSEEYGELIFLVDRVTPFSPAEMLATFEERLSFFEFDPEKDFVCYTGKTLSLVLLSLAVWKKYKVIPALMFDARSSKYVERIIEAEDSNAQ